jgi:DNA-binding NarL/FixJ family response regulator
MSAEPSMPGRVLIVEDHPIFADALRMTLADAMSEACIVHAASLCEARTALAREAGFDLVLLDLCLPDAHGLTGLTELRQRFPKLPILIVSASTDQAVVHKSLACGAAGFIPKSAPRHVLVRAIGDVLAGETVLPPDYLFLDATAGPHRLN